MQLKRAASVAVGALGLVVAAVFLRETGPSGLGSWMRCTFHDWTGLSCPGCGMTRGTYAALHGRLGEAFRYNPLGMLLLPVLCIGLTVETWGWVRGKPFGSRFKPGKTGVWILGVLVVVFWVLRNIPKWPFTLLAPP
jgi:hypothetical protein